MSDVFASHQNSIFPSKGPYTRPMCTETPNQATSVEQQMQR